MRAHVKRILDHASMDYSKAQYVLSRIRDMKRNKVAKAIEKNVALWMHKSAMMAQRTISEERDGHVNSAMESALEAHGKADMAHGAALALEIVCLG